jgi:uncharacterized repeat protein (TIGR01451 family)
MPCTTAMCWAQRFISLCLLGGLVFSVHAGAAMPTADGSAAGVLRPAGGAGARLSSAGALLPTLSACPEIAIGPKILPRAEYGVPYRNALTQAGGVGTVTYVVSAGALPAGISLSPAGRLSGKSTKTGIPQFTVTVTDGRGCMGSQSFDLIVGPARVSLQMLAETATVPAGGAARYTLRVTNESAGMVGQIVVTDSLPRAMAFVGAEPTEFSANGQQIVWKLKNVPAGATRELTLSTRAASNAGGQVTNAASAATTGDYATAQVTTRIVTP